MASPSNFLRMSPEQLLNADPHHMCGPDGMPTNTRQATSAAAATVTGSGSHDFPAGTPLPDSAPPRTRNAEDLGRAGAAAYLDRSNFPSPPAEDIVNTATSACNNVVDGNLVGPTQSCVVASMVSFLLSLRAYGGHIPIFMLGGAEFGETFGELVKSIWFFHMVPISIDVLMGLVRRRGASVETICRTALSLQRGVYGVSCFMGGQWRKLGVIVRTATFHNSGALFGGDDVAQASLLEDDHHRFGFLTLMTGRQLVPAASSLFHALHNKYMSYSTDLRFRRDAAAATFHRLFGTRVVHGAERSTVKIAAAVRFYQALEQAGVVFAPYQQANKEYWEAQLGFDRVIGGPARASAAQSRLDIEAARGRAIDALLALD